MAKKILLVTLVIIVSNLRLQSQTNYIVTIISNPVTGGSATGAGIYETGSSVTVTATTNPDYKFLGWTEGAYDISTNPGYTFTLTGNRILVANFSRITYTISVITNPPNSATTAGGGIYMMGATASITVTPAAGYQFVSWTQGTNVISTNPVYSFPVSENFNLVANLIPLVFNLTGPENQLINNNDTIKIDESEAGSFSIKVESNNEWHVSDNSICLKAVKVNNSRLDIAYMENISVIDKTSAIKVRNQLNVEILFYIKQRARESAINLQIPDMITLYPNPVGEFLYIKTGEAMNRRIKISIIDFKGHFLSSYQSDNFSSKEPLSLSLSGLAPGNYLIILEDGIFKQIEQIIKY